METLSLYHVEYDNSKSLKQNCFRLGMFYTAKHVVRRIYRLVERNGFSVKDIKSLRVISYANKLYFRVYFEELCIEWLNDYILGRK